MRPRRRGARRIESAHGKATERKGRTQLQWYELPDAGDRLVPTERERQVLQEIAEGYNARQAGARLGISHWTVRHHLRNVNVLLGARNVAHSVAIALRRGYIE